MPSPTVAQPTRRTTALLAFVAMTAMLVLVPSPALSVEMCGGFEVTIPGTEDDDVLPGTSGPDVIAGFGGNDTITALGGDDVVCGGDGNDIIFGGWGSDTIFGENGSDTIEGEGGPDLLDGGGGTDIINGGGGPDVIDGGSGKDTIDGGPGSDDLDGGTGADTVDGGDGNDTLSGGGAGDTLLGGHGNDDLQGNSGKDVLKGEQGNDFLSGGNHDDELRGGNDDDDLMGDKGNDSLIGGNGNDELRGGHDDDSLLGGNDDDVLSGQAGVDVANGGAGEDDCAGETANACEEGLIDFSFDRFYINQAVPAADSSDSPADKIEPVVGRAGIVRAFFSADRLDTDYEPVVKLHWMKTGGETGEMVLDGPATLKTDPDEANLGHSHDYVFDDAFLEEGMEFYVEVDGDSDLIESKENNNRYPSSGWLDPNVIPVPTLEITFVPIGFDGGSAPTVTQQSGLGLLEDTTDVHPIAEIDIEIHDPINYDPLGTFSDWTIMLDMIRQLDCPDPCSEGSGRAFAGIVGSDPSESGVGGIGYVNTNLSFVWPYSVSRPNPSVIAHELGHNFGRSHVNCRGIESGPDPDYPYDTGGPFGNGGGIGTWGYEADTGTLKDPAVYNDLMTYCNSEWVSDYTYEAVLDFRASGEGFDIIQLPDAASAVTFSGSLHGDSVASLRIPDVGDPRARFDSAVASATSLPALPGGAHQVVGLDAEGLVVTSAFFPVHEVADTLDISDVFHFSFAIPVADSDLARIVSWEIHDSAGLLATRSAG